MPGRKAKPPRLWLRAEPDGRHVWVVLHRGRHIRTGCGEADVQGATDALTDYLAGRHQAVIDERDPGKLRIGDVLTLYEQSKRPSGYDSGREPITDTERETFRRHGELVGRLDNINSFFGAHAVRDIKKQLCVDYVDWCIGEKNERNNAKAIAPRRVRPGKNVRGPSAQTARRELEDLRAAVNAYHGDHVLDAVPKITLPAKSESRDRWLTRTEAARLLGAALGFVWDPVAGTWKREDGRLVRRDRITRARRRHAARFILIGLYSARREQTIRRTLWLSSTTNPWFDLERNIYHGRGREERQTKKRRPPAAIANRLRAHLRRWHRMDTALAGALHDQGARGPDANVRYVVHLPDGRPLRGKIKTGWNSIVADAGLDDEVVRHVLRHTAATWTMQAGADLWQAAGWLGMTVEQLEETYGHHHPNFQGEVAAAIGYRR